MCRLNHMGTKSPVYKLDVPNTQPIGFPILEETYLRAKQESSFLSTLIVYLGNFRSISKGLVPGFSCGETPGGRE